MPARAFKCMPVDIVTVLSNGGFVESLSLRPEGNLVGVRCDLIPLNPGRNDQQELGWVSRYNSRHCPERKEERLHRGRCLKLDVPLEACSPLYHSELVAACHSIALTTVKTIQLREWLRSWC